MWISQLAAPHYEDSLSRLILNLTWIGLNAAATPQSHQEVMHFGGTLKHVIEHILTVEPSICPIYLSKVDLADVYMHL